MGDENEQEQEHSEEVQGAIEAARAFVAPRYAGFDIQPEIYTIRVCGRTAVLLPLTLAGRDAWMRKIADWSPAERSTQAHWSLLIEVLFWVEGMPLPSTEDKKAGPPQSAAVKYAKLLAGLGGSLAFLGDKLAGEYLRLTDEAGGKAAGKKQ